MADSTTTIGTGGDYSTTASWFAAKKSVSGTHTGQVKNETVSGQLLANDATTSATAFILEPESGAEHSGISEAAGGGGAVLENVAGAAILWSQSNNKPLTVQDLIIQGNVGIQFDDAGCALTVLRCVFETGVGGIDANASSLGVLTIHDSILEGGSGLVCDCRGGTSSSIIGCTVIGNGSTHGIVPKVTAASVVANNISMGHSTEDYWSDDNTNTNHKNNLAEDTTADAEYNGGGGGANSVEYLETGDTPTKDYVAFVSKTAGSEDYHLVDLEHGTYDNLAIAAGAPSLGSGTDIDRESRDGSTPDIGADEMTAAETGDTRNPIFMVT